MNLVNMFIKLSVIWILSSIVSCQDPNYDWELAVVVENQLKLLQANGSEIQSKSQPFSSLKALAYDNIRQQFIVSDMDEEMKNDTIYTVQLFNETDMTVPIVQGLPGDVQGLAVDPIDDILYWTDAINHTINTVFLNNTFYESKPLFTLEDQKPQSIVIDICKRYIYWTNPSKKPTIERARLDGTDREVIVDDLLISPEGLALDYTAQKLYWADSRAGSSSGKIESIGLDGRNREVVVERNTMQPFGIAVDDAAIYWTDTNNKGLYKFLKGMKPDEAPEKLLEFEEMPMGLIANNNIIKEEPDCQYLEQAIQTYKKESSVEVYAQPAKQEFKTEEKICLNGGEYIENGCKCKRGFVGTYCENAVCHNLCLHGNCYVSSLGKPLCHCEKGYIGQRCERNKCDGFCLNGGQCSTFSLKDVTKCSCREGYIGDRCEYNIQICDTYCQDQDNELYTNKFELLCRCDEGFNFNNTAKLLITPQSDQPSFLQKLTEPVFYLAAIILFCLLVIISLVVYIRTIHKRRPRIKKRIIVNKNVTPLTYRPQSNTQQCEITIENCCNMNVCETPCFEPREDKKKLLTNMEGEDY